MSGRNYYYGIDGDELRDIQFITFKPQVGASVKGIFHTSFTASPAQVAANTTAEQTFTVTGLLAGDVVFVNKPTSQAGLGIAGVRVSAANTIAVTFVNATASPITPTASETYQVGVIR